MPSHGTAQSTYYGKDKFKCYTCSPGYYANATGSAKCEVCPDGHYCYRTQCYSCSPGYYASSEGLASCNACPDGYQCCDARAEPSICPVGTSQNTYYIKDRKHCYDCNLGYYADNPGTLSCKACPDGHYCEDHKSSPKPCPSGYISYYYVKDRTTCYPCTQDYTNNQASTSCVSCPGCPNIPTMFNSNRQVGRTECNVDYSYNYCFNQEIEEKPKRPLDISVIGPILNTIVSHSGVVVTLTNGVKYLVHKGKEYGKASQTGVVSTTYMSHLWRFQEECNVHVDRTVSDYVTAGGINYDLFNDNCNHASARMMALCN
ncbi:unnamed protein product [Brachionus calyciflorus]|uniref:Tyrosine-protein kinase ephrin type A/B receptor-like domain-containing protein n=1 Tax=Brachionus calyciflorus TaxID=104777 RepID=A0A814D2C0_9BILA|nr:unnamed protein product [Brachionus calyciflorus]